MKKTGFLFLVCFALGSCSSLPLVTSEADEAKMGDEAYRQMLQKERVANHPKWNAMLQRVGQRVAAAANKPDFKWEFKLIESKEKNAFCLPGGKVAFYTGIMPVFENEAQMAAVMGHEVAHATARHGGKRISAALGQQVLLGGVSILLGQDSTKKNLVLAAFGMGSNVVGILPFSRGQETEADEIGLSYMARAGYDPREASKFWERFAKESGSSPPTWLSTHPASASRQENLRGRVSMVMGEYDRSPKFGTGEKL